MICSSCKEEVSSKSKHALSQNICPVCGGTIFSNADLFFRKSIGEILKKHGVAEDEKILNITNEIGDVLDGPEPEELPHVEESEETIIHGERVPGIKKEPRKITRAGTMAGADQGTEPSLVPPSNEITLDDIAAAESDESPVSPEEKAEVDAMISSGEIVFSNTMIKDDKKIPSLIKKIPQAITRI